ncbi:tol-pal system-associated acyl-CoA thioesterase [Rhabdochromatium marinum]|nr:tol-pal system-associated acyl-CoA thioesterase [Rhabdochromatium marinum]MBK1647132.1 tol-pal system-associated acyl-CoA thioesterase [Rhabdochromatium marinum]
MHAAQSQDSTSSQPPTFVWPVRVYYEDTDAGGVVYNANYLRFFERARTEWLRALGFEQDQLRATHDLLFVMRRINVRFVQPARFNDALSVTVVVQHLGRASIDFEQQIRRVADDQLCCQAEVNIAAVSAASLRPTRIPPHLFAEIADER